MKKSKLLSSLIFVIVFAMLPIADVWAQTVQGTVTTAKGGEALPGVNVVVVGENAGTSTDADGKYSLEVQSLQNNKLRFSFIGFKNRVVPIDGRSTVDVTLQTEASQLGELVVTGYGTERQADLTTSVSTVNAADLDVTGVTSFSEALAGESPGVRIQQTSGAPGGGISIKIRGQGSINASNDPLYVIDGVQLGSTGQSGIGGGNNNINPLASLDPNDIESINILKSASATSIYGSRGANGVVVVTTKSGKAGQSQIDFQLTTGWQQNARNLDIMSKEEYLQEQIDSKNIGWAAQAPGNSRNDPNSVRPQDYKIPIEYQNPSQLSYTKWQDALYRDAAPKRKYSLSASGGTENIQYFVSGNYNDVNGLVVNSNFKNYGLRANVTGDISDNIQVGINVAPSYSTRNEANQSGIAYYGGGVATLFNNGPFAPIYNDDGSYSYSYSLNYDDGSQSIRRYSNPIGAAYGIDRSIDHFQTTGNTFVKIDFLDKLSFKSSISGDFNFYNRNVFNPSTVADHGLAPVVQTGRSFAARDIRWDNRNLLTYDDSFNDKHNLNVLLGLEEQKSNFLNTNVNARGFPNDRVATLNVGQINGGSSRRNAWTLLSMLGRVKYNYDQKYFASATLRRDGSSRFGENNKWGYFPSISAGWRIAQEDFMNDVSAVSTLKLRASYGVTGNNGIGNYAPIGSVGQSDIILGEPAAIVNGLYQSSLSNPDLGWEKQKEVNIGLDLGLYNERVQLTADVYNRVNDDLLLSVSLPLATGYSNTTRNLGEVRNHGLELGLKTINVQSSDFNWSTQFNFSLNRNKVLDFNGQRELVQDYQFYNPEFFLTEKGLPVGSYYGYVYEGVYKNMEEFQNHAHFAGEDDNPLAALGAAKFKDLNGDGEITPDGDRKVLGNNYPDFIYGISSNLNYKGVNFSFQLQGEQGVEQLNLLKNSLYRRVGADFKNYWRSPENPGDGQTFAPTGGTGHNREPSTFYVEDASFLRITNVNLGYQLPQNIFGGGGVLREVRIFLNATNLYTFTDYKGYNPQARSNSPYNQVLRPGIDFGSYPLARTLSVGIDVGL